MATYSEAFNRMGDAVLDTTKKVAEINVRAGEKLLEQQAEFANQWVNAVTRNVDLTAKAMGFHELFSGQAQIAQEYTQQFLNNWRRSAEIIGEAGRAAAEAMEQAGQAARQETRRQTQQGWRERLPEAEESESREAGGQPEAAEAEAGAAIEEVEELDTTELQEPPEAPEAQRTGKKVKKKKR